MRGLLCAILAAVVFESLLSSLLLLSGPMVLAMLLSFAFVSAFSIVLFLVFVTSIVFAFLM